MMMPCQPRDGLGVDSNFSNLEQNQFDKIYRAKTPRRKEKNLLIYRTWRALRPFDVAQDMLFACHVFPIRHFQTTQILNMSG
jgi:hypothetical protein